MDPDPSRAGGEHGGAGGGVHGRTWWAYTTIQAGIDAALAAGGVNQVRVAEGTYPEQLSIVASDLGDLSVSGGWLPGFMARVASPSATTIIDAGRTGPALALRQPFRSRGALDLDGFTFRRGLNTLFGTDCPIGGGLQIELSGQAEVTVRRSTIEDNEISIACSAEGGGVGAILQEESRLALLDNEIPRNFAASVTNSASGGGVTIYALGNNRVEVAGNKIRENRADCPTNAHSGGLMVIAGAASQVIVTDNRITGNHVSTTFPAPPGSPGGFVSAAGSSRVEVPGCALEVLS